jgi:hypothetical protein
MYVYCFTLSQGQCKYLSTTFTWPCENILGSVSVHYICLMTIHPPPTRQGFPT